MKFLQENQITTTVNQSEGTAANTQLESNAPMKTLLTELSNWPIDQLTSSKIEDSKTLYDVLLQIQNLSESPIKQQLEFHFCELIKEGPKKTKQIQNLSEILEKDWLTLFKGEPESAEAFPSIQYDLLKILTSKSKEELTTKTNVNSIFTVMSKIKDTEANHQEVLTKASRRDFK